MNLDASAEAAWEHRRQLLPSPPTAASATGVVHERDALRSALVICFIVALITPFIFYIGPLRLSAYRVVLLLLLIPMVLLWAAGRYGRVRAVDLLVFIHAFWVTAALLINHGFAKSLEFVGMYTIETVGPFLLARWCIRDRHDFRLFATAWLTCIAILVPFAVAETLTSNPILLTVLGKLAPVLGNVFADPRWGLDRAQAVFEHPILFGVFCAGAFGVNFCLRYRRVVLQRTTRTLIVAAATFCSLSAGAWTALLIQGLLYLWDFTTRRWARRWAILGALIFLAYVVVDLLAKATPLQVFFRYFTFDLHNAYIRVAIWEYGSASVWNHPFVGTGGEWERPAWLPPSIDNFWLVLAVAYGLPAFASLAAAVCLLCWQLGRRQLDEDDAACRLGLLVSIGGLSIAAATVHFWGATYCILMFLLGSGMWMLEAPAEQPKATDVKSSTKPAGATRELLPIRYRDGSAPR